MDFFRGGKMRLLYLLALVQLVGGPLVLLQVTVFCKLALHEAPKVGLAKATETAWDANEFQTVLADAAVLPHHGKKSVPPTSDPKVKLDKAKQPLVPWKAAEMELYCQSIRCGIVDRARIWTPAWPQAPPGPPPRVG